MVAAHHKLAAAERSILSGDASRTIAWVRSDWEFHRSIVSACHSESLLMNLSSVFDRFLRYHLLAKSFRGQAVADDHRALFELALARDSKAAKEIIHRHVMSGVEHIRTQLGLR